MGIFFLDTMMERIFDIVGGVLNFIWSILISLIYGLIIVAFNAFNSLSQLDIVSSSQINGIYQRLVMIMTIIMIFYISFEFVKYVVSPDTFTDKEKGAGKIIYRIVIAIVLIAFIPNIFSTAKDLQVRILNTNVISKVIFGKDDFNYKSAGNGFVGDIFAAFYRVNYNNCGGKGSSACNQAEQKVNKVISEWKAGKGVSGLWDSFWQDVADIDNTIQYDGLLAVIFGGFMLYVLILYNIDIVVRYLQLFFLQIMAPVAIISSILPNKDSMLKKWTKQCTTTYLDIFIRIAILYVMILIISILSESLDLFNLSRNGDQIGIFAYLMIIVGLLVFVQRAPKLIKELFPALDSGASIGFGFSGKSRFGDIGKTISTASKPLAATAGAATGIKRSYKSWRNGELYDRSKTGRAKRIMTGMTTMGAAAYKGAASGFKSGRFSQAKYDARRAVQEDEKTVRDGGTILGRRFRGDYYQNEKEDLDKQLNVFKKTSEHKSNISGAIDEFKGYKQLVSMKTTVSNMGTADDLKEYEGLIKKVEKEYRKFGNGQSEADTKTNIDNLLSGYLAVGNRSNFGIDASSIDYELNNSDKANNLRTVMNGAITHIINAAQKEYTYYVLDESGNKVRKHSSFDSSTNQQVITSEVLDSNGNVSRTLPEERISLERMDVAGDYGSHADRAKSASQAISNSEEFERASANAMGGNK